MNAAAQISPDWVAVDWGTSHLRAWAMDPSSHVLAERRSDRGMGTLGRDAFEATLLQVIAPWLGSAPLTVVACGMLGSRQGWVEAPYRSVPCTPGSAKLVRAPVTDRRVQVFVASGLRQDAQPDVMRGEETQIAGFLAGNPGFEGIVCLPGTHTKWAEVSANEVVSFRTIMTGELFALLTRNSVLQHSVDQDWDPVAFDEAVADALSSPERVAQRLFSVRATDLLVGLAPGEGAARISGALIGMELAATRAYWLGRPIAVVGGDAADRTYMPALRAQGLSPVFCDADVAVRAGLADAHVALERPVA
ncbi:MAG: 2-dehydro-3-deoxygalactonokinase [Pseudomonadota bacterium]